MYRLSLLTAFAPLLCTPLAGAQAPIDRQAPDEIVVVVGRQPGPPLWRVTHGEHMLWIFPYLSPVPKDMIWDTEKTAAVIEEAQEVIELPRVTALPSTGVLLNPLNLFRGLRVLKRMRGNPNDASLEAVLPADLYARFTALGARYFPRDRDFEALRPLAAGLWMVDIVQEAEGLKSGEDTLQAIQRLVRRNRAIERTEIEARVEIEGNFRAIADRAEMLADSLDPAGELACFEAMLARMENDLDEIKRLANAWALGYVDELRVAPRADEERCSDLLLASSERQLLLEMTELRDRLWLEAAERALVENATTFAILAIGDLVDENGVVSQLRAKGYQVREP